MASNNENSSPESSEASIQIINISSDSEDDVNFLPKHRPRFREDTVTDSAGKNDVIELTDSESSDTSDLPDTLSPLVKGWRKKIFRESRTRQTSGGFMPLFVDTSNEDESDDNCILVLDDLPNFRRPMKTMPTVKGQDVGKTSPLLDSPKKNIIPDVSHIAQKSPSKRMGRCTSKTKEQARRQKYAIELFAKLNRDVFGDRLPKDTSIEWSKRLLTTAGRARWHRSHEGEHTVKIELASKILDCDERIRNTLSHEMCHLACWVIDNQPQEGHGRLFKSWAGKVTNKHPDIHISTRHTYEISYPYEWKCEECSKIHGRHSKSIRPDECVCGACRVGKLIPLFVERKKVTVKVSRMAVEQSLYSPYPMIGGPARNGNGSPPSVNLDDSDIPDLVNVLERVSINSTRD